MWLAGAVLLGFHVWLLWDHATSGRLFEPVVALRWTLGLGLFTAMVSLRAVGLPALSGRHAAVIWVLVSLLHWHAMAASAPSPAEVDLGLPVEIASSGVTGVAGATLAVLLVGVLLAIRRAAAVSLRRWFARRPLARRTLALAHLRVVGCRPPPLVTFA